MSQHVMSDAPRGLPTPVETAELPSDTDARDDTVTFSSLGVPAPLVRGLTRTGIHSPFPIQTATLPDALAGRDVLGRGQTGSGKTLAFGLAMLTRLTGGAAAPGKPHGLILVPTRELAFQVNDALRPLAQATSIRTTVVVGGMTFARQYAAMKAGADIVVATPGRLADLINQGRCSLSEVRITVLDEADHMADLGFLPAVTALLEQTPADGQRLLFSATLDRGVDGLVRKFLTNAVSHSTAPSTASVSTMSHHVVEISPHDKNEIIARIAAREGSTLLFVRTKHGADRLAQQLRKRGVPTGALHGGKTQVARNRTLNAFRAGAATVLVATDVAARGIHVDDVSLVLNVDLPAEPKDYLHRAGRTARAGDSGMVVTLVMSHQRRDMERLAKAARVSPSRLRATPLTAALAELTGARTPSDVPVEEPVAPKAPRSDDGRGSGDRAGRRRPGRGSAERGGRTGRPAGSGGRGRGPRRTDGSTGGRSFGGRGEGHDRTPRERVA
jgi:superfamily II DNA/RNA helicase